jgi:hypothetical protein
MSTEPDPRRVSLVEAVADRTPVDWGRITPRDPGDEAFLTHLRSVDLIARVMARAGEDATPAATPPPRWGSLELRQKLGEGSFGEVFLAFDPALHREVALKLRRVASTEDAAARRWLDEARRMARVRHPNVLVIHGAAVHDGRAGMWTDHLVGRTLEDDIAARGPLGAREAAIVGMDLCGALAAVHAAGLIHGDVTTRNVMREGEAGALDGSGRIVLMDFGSAHEAGGGAAAFGTPLFMAPEVLAGGDASVASDVYALGVLLFRIVTAHYPFEARSLDELRQRLDRGESLSLRTARPDLRQPFVAVVERAIASDPAARFVDAAAMERALALTLGSGSRTAMPRPRAARRALVPALAVIATLALAAVILGPRPGARGGREVVGPAPTTAPAPAAAQAPGRVAMAAIPAPEAIAPRPPEVEATLQRARAGALEPLRRGDAIAPGDRLVLTLESREPVHAYVLDEDQHGEIYMLFPLQVGGARNPLAAGVRHRLPGRDAGVELDWQVTSAGGRETILVLAARTPLDAVEQARAALASASSGAAVRYAPLAPEVLSRLRGVARVAPAEPTPTAAAAPPGGRLAALARTLSDPARPQDVWIRLIELDNP